MVDVERMKAPNWPYVSLCVLRSPSYMGWVRASVEQRRRENDMLPASHKKAFRTESGSRC